MKYYGYLVAFSAAMGGLLFGYEIGVISQTLSMISFGLQFDIVEFSPVGQYSNGSYFLNQTVASPPFVGAFCTKFNATVAACETPSTASTSGLVTFTFLVGCAVGAIVVSMLADLWGRKKCIFTGAILFLAGGVMQSVASSFTIFFGGRVLSGLGIGILSMASPLYIAEAAPTSIRGRMVAIQQLMITLGIVVSSVCNSIIILTIGNADPLNGLEWRLALGLQCIPAFLLAVIMMFMPESPRWLAEKGLNEQTLYTIAKLRSSSVNDHAVTDEYQEIMDGVEFERTIGNGSWSELFQKGLRNRVAITCTLQFFQQWTGINVILYYQTSLLQGMGLDPISAAIPFTLANNVVNFLATFPGMYLVEKIGRRSLLLYGGIGMGCAHYLVCLFLNLAKHYQAVGGPSSTMFYLAISSVYLFFICFASSWGPVAWIYQSEVFPLRVRAKGTGLASLSNWVNNAIIAYVILIIQKALKPNEQQMYLIFGIYVCLH